MKQTIYKFKVEPNPELQTIELPYNARIESVIEQNGEIMIYAMTDVNPFGESLMQQRRIYVVGTGWEIDMTDLFESHFIGTVKVGPFVWHVFEVDDLPF